MATPTLASTAPPSPPTALSEKLAQESPTPIGPAPSAEPTTTPSIVPSPPPSDTPDLETGGGVSLFLETPPDVPPSDDGLDGEPTTPPRHAHHPSRIPVHTGKGHRKPDALLTTRDEEVDVGATKETEGPSAKAGVPSKSPRSPTSPKSPMPPKSPKAPALTSHAHQHYAIATVERMEASHQRHDALDHLTHALTEVHLDQHADRMTRSAERRKSLTEAFRDKMVGMAEDRPARVRAHKEELEREREVQAQYEAHKHAREQRDAEQRRREGLVGVQKKAQHLADPRKA